MQLHVRHWAVLVVAALALAACSDDGAEPDPTGAIAGTVTDANQTGVPGATVQIMGSTASATTDASGAFRFDDLAVGSYTLSITVPQGFELAANEAQTKTVEVADGQTATADWSLVETTTGGDVVEIHLTTSLTFSPDSVEISPGTTVRWINDGGTHTVTPRDTNQPGVWTRQTTSSAGTVFEHTFNTAGEVYDYFCEPHEAQGMTGKIVVTQ